MSILSVLSPGPFTGSEDERDANCGSTGGATDCRVVSVTSTDAPLPLEVEVGPVGGRVFPSGATGAGPAGKLPAESDGGGGLMSFPVSVIASPSSVGESGRPGASVGPPVCVGGLLPGIIARGGALAAGADDGVDETWGCCSGMSAAGADAPVAEAA